MKFEPQPPFKVISLVSSEQPWQVDNCSDQGFDSWSLQTAHPWVLRQVTEPWIVSKSKLLVLVCVRDLTSPHEGLFILYPGYCGFLIYCWSWISARIPGNRPDVAVPLESLGAVSICLQLKPDRQNTRSKWCYHVYCMTEQFDRNWTETVFQLDDSKGEM